MFHETREIRRIGGIAVAIGVLAGLSTGAVAGPRSVTVQDHGAVGDGRTLDTTALQQAIDACAAAGGGQVVLPPGRYLSGTIQLKSHITLVLQAGATLVGSDSLEAYQHFQPPPGTPEARFRPQWHRALILGVGVQQVGIVGEGVIDGNQVFDAQGEERMRGPHTILLGHCQQVTLRDLSIKDSANYAVMLEDCQQVVVQDVTITGGWDGVHFRGWPDRWCRDVRIVGCQLFTGDDAIAGRYWQDVLVRDCVINSSCNGLRLIGPAERLIVQDCLFYGPGRYEHRTSHRTNMLAGINLQPGGWDATQGPLDQVLISDITMQNVATPVILTLKPGNTAGQITVSRLSATGVYRAALSIESWAEQPIQRVVLRNLDVEYLGGGQRDSVPPTVQQPGVDARPLPSWGCYARHVNQLQLEDVRLSCTEPDGRPVLMCDQVQWLQLDTVRFPQPPDSTYPFVLHDVQQVQLRDLPAAAR